jgi:hypothetical protein
MNAQTGGQEPGSSKQSQASEDTLGQIVSSSLHLSDWTQTKGHPVPSPRRAAVEQRRGQRSVNSAWNHCMRFSTRRLRHPHLLRPWSLRCWTSLLSWLEAADERTAVDLDRAAQGALRNVASNHTTVAVLDERPRSRREGHRVGSKATPRCRDRRSDRQVAACSARRLHRPCRARPADRSLVAKDRSAAGVRDRTGPEPAGTVGTRGAGR